MTPFEEEAGECLVCMKLQCTLNNSKRHRLYLEKIGHEGAPIMRKWLAGMSLLLFLTGCTEREKISTYTMTDNTQQQQEVEQLFENDSEIEQVNIVVIENELFVAMQLKPMKKWNRQKIEERWQKKLEKQFSTSIVSISADFKMFWESSKLMEEKDQQKMLKELQHLKKLSKEET